MILFLKFSSITQREVPEPLVDPASGEKIKKRVFMMVCTGVMSRGKARKIAETYGANIYPYPENALDAQRRADGIRAELDNKQTV